MYSKSSISFYLYFVLFGAIYLQVCHPYRVVNNTCIMSQERNQRLLLLIFKSVFKKLERRCCVGLCIPLSRGQSWFFAASCFLLCLAILVVFSFQPFILTFQIDYSPLSSIFLDFNVSYECYILQALFSHNATPEFQLSHSYCYQQYLCSLYFQNILILFCL